jgi:hypothetical protein
MPYTEPDMPVVPRPRHGPAYRLGAAMGYLVVLVVSTTVALVMLGLLARASWVLMRLGWGLL